MTSTDRVSSVSTAIEKIRLLTQTALRRDHVTSHTLSIRASRCRISLARLRCLMKPAERPRSLKIGRFGRSRTAARARPVNLVVFATIH